MKVGIAGLGTIGLRHLSTLRDVEGVEVAGVADPRLAGEDGLAVPAFASYEEMLDSVPLGAVVLSTPSWLHAEQGVLAAERGIHVVSEKPMATTLAGAHELVDACERNGVRLAVLHQYRFHAPLMALRAAIEQGELGSLVFVNLHFHWRRDREYYEKDGGWRGTWRGDGGGALMNQGSHAVDLARWLGGPIHSVTACTANVAHPIEAEDTISVSLRFESGGLGTIQVTTCASKNHPARVEVQGTEASATVFGRTLVLGDAQPVDVEPAIEPHRAQFREIFGALHRDGVPPVEGRDAQQTLADTLAIYESAHAGAVVRCAPAGSLLRARVA